jgi:membrane-bound lytic murein transglycosylase B
MARVRLRYAFLGALVLATVQARADDTHGWTYLVDRLAADGVARERAVATFTDPRMPAFTGLEFGLAPREPHSLYRRFLAASSIAAARRCRTELAGALEAAERAHGVSANVVAALLYVETGCGRNTGGSPTLFSLARLAMANEPENLRENVERHTGGVADAAVIARVRERARYLEETFYPEVRATFTLADRLGIDPLALRGSGSGAFGYPQFLPTSYLRYGTDGDGDGVVDLYDSRDAAASCANYLAAQGWKTARSDAERRAVIWRYNHSAPYVDTVLTLARRIGEPCVTRAARVRATGRGKSRTVRSARNTRRSTAPNA